MLEEYGFFAVLVPMLKGMGEEGLKAFARAGSKLWASFGYTTAQEGRATPHVSEIAKSGAAEGIFPIDVVVYPDVLIDRDFIADNISETYENRLRVAGAKLTIDGSPQGFTAWRDRPYFDPVGEYASFYKGYAAVTNEQAMDLVFGVGTWDDLRYETVDPGVLFSGTYTFIFLADPPVFFAYARQTSESAGEVL